MYELPQPSTHGLEVIGALPSGAQLEGNPGSVSAWVRRALDSVGVKDPLTRYGMMYPTRKRYYNAFLKYDRVRATLSDHNETALAFALYCVRRIYTVHVSGWRVLDHDQVVLPWNAGSGWPYNMCCTSKEAAMRKFGWRFEVYWHLIGLGCRPFDVWQVFIKKELLPMRKLESDDGRTIINPPVHVAYAENRMFSDFNHRIAKSWRTTPCKLGFTRYYGEFHTFAEYLNFHPNKREKDATKWDASKTKLYAQLACDFRAETIAPVDKTRENLNRMRTLVLEAEESRMLMPNNVLVQKDGGTSSGSDNTSTHNTLGGEIGGYHDWYLLVSSPLIASGDLTSLSFHDLYSHMDANWRHGRAGDDELESYSDEVADLYSTPRVIEAAEKRKFSYPPEKVKSQRTLEGLKFLGSSFHWSQHYQRWVPVYDGDKALHSLLYPESGTSIHQDLYRCLALRAESYWDEATRGIFTAVRDYLERHGAVPRPTRRTVLPADQIAALMDRTDRQLIKLYFGLEEAGSKFNSNIAYTSVDGQKVEQSEVEGCPEQESPSSQSPPVDRSCEPNQPTTQTESFCCSGCHPSIIETV